MSSTLEKIKKCCRGETFFAPILMKTISFIKHPIPCLLIRQSFNS